MTNCSQSILPLRRSLISNNTHRSPQPRADLNRPFDSSIDIWFFGCLVYEILTSGPLFTVAVSGYDQAHRDKADDDHSAQLNDEI